MKEQKIKQDELIDEIQELRQEIFKKMCRLEPITNRNEKIDVPDWFEFPTAVELKLKDIPNKFQKRVRMALYKNWLWHEQVKQPCLWRLTEVGWLWHYKIGKVVLKSLHEADFVEPYRESISRFQDAVYRTAHNNCVNTRRNTEQ